MAFKVSRPVQVQDRGAARLLRDAANAHFQIRLGVFGDAKHEGASGADGGEMTIARLLEIHELGLGVPERSILRAWAEKHEADIQNDMRAAVRQMLTGRLSPDRAAKLLGVRWVGQLQTFISSGQVEPPLAQSTIDKKGSSVPLIDTGQLRSALTFLVDRALGRTP